MKFDNEISVNKIQIQKQLYSILIGAIIAFMFSSDLWQNVEGFTGTSKWVHSSILIAIYMVFYLYHIIVRSSFLLFSDDGKSIIIKYYKLNPFDNKKNAYEIPKEQFVGYTVNKSLFGLRESVSVIRKLGNGNAQYPPFSISTLPKPLKKKLFAALDFYTQK